MARRTYRGDHIPGLRAVLIRKRQQIDDHFCLGADCNPCRDLAVLRVPSEPFICAGGSIASSVWGSEVGEAVAHLRDDDSIYALVGDRLRVATDREAIAKYGEEDTRPA